MPEHIRSYYLALAVEPDPPVISSTSTRETAQSERPSWSGGSLHLRSANCRPGASAVTN